MGDDDESADGYLGAPTSAREYALRKAQSSNLRSLLEKVECATGPDQELDAWVMAALFPELEPAHLVGSNASIRMFDRGYGGPGSALRLTTSLDAVLSLVEEKLPGWHWSIVRDKATHRRRYFAQMSVPHNYIDNPGPWPEGSSDGASPALAVLACFLRALIAKQEREAKVDG